MRTWSELESALRSTRTLARFPSSRPRPLVGLDGLRTNASRALRGPRCWTNCRMLWSAAGNGLWITDTCDLCALLDWADARRRWTASDGIAARTAILFGYSPVRLVASSGPPSWPTVPKLDVGEVLIEFVLGPELAQLASKKPIATRTIIAFINTLRTFVWGKPGQVDCSLFTPHDNAAMVAEGFDTSV
jgi:hypothetical protein